MDINEIRKMIKGKNDRIIIVDSNGNPAFVISAYDSLNNPNCAQEILDQKSEEKNHDFDLNQENDGSQPKRLTIEDLPYL